MIGMVLAAGTASAVAASQASVAYSPTRTSDGTAQRKLALG